VHNFFYTMRLFCSILYTKNYPIICSNGNKSAKKYLLKYSLPQEASHKLTFRTTLLAISNSSIVVNAGASGSASVQHLMKFNFNCVVLFGFDFSTSFWGSEISNKHSFMQFIKKLLGIFTAETFHSLSVWATVAPISRDSSVVKGRISALTTAQEITHCSNATKQVPPYCQICPANVKAFFTTKQVCAFIT